MEFAIYKEKRIKATKGAKGYCPLCDSELVAKCGEVNIHHWAHKTKCTDHWWESETPWHRNWKNKFPNEWQEIVHHDESGEKHIADVKTGDGWVIEFQHSYLKPEERHSRNNFYKKLIWVIDGTRRKTDIEQFQNILNDATVDKPSQKLLVTPILGNRGLFGEWKGCESIVLVDFQDSLSCNGDLWLLYPAIHNADKDYIFLSQLSKSVFIEFLSKNRFDEIIDKVINPVRVTVKHSIEENKKRNEALQSKKNFCSEGYLKWRWAPKSYLGHLKLPYGILNKIERPTNLGNTVK